MGTEDNNLNKERYSRPQIAATVNHYVPSLKIMFEFLGDGIGAEFYAKNLKDLLVIDLCERNRKKFKEWKDSGRHEALPVKYKQLHKNASKCFNELYQYNIEHPKHACKYNFINLDFCTFFFDNGRDNCTASLIKEVFEKDIIQKNGVIAFTFQITGIGVNMSKVALKNKNDILAAIKKIAEDRNHRVEEIFSYAYKASKPTTMLNLMIKVY